MELESICTTGTMQVIVQWKILIICKFLPMKKWKNTILCFLNHTVYIIRKIYRELAKFEISQPDNEIKAQKKCKGRRPGWHMLSLQHVYMLPLKLFTLCTRGICRMPWSSSDASQLATVTICIFMVTLVIMLKAIVQSAMIIL